MTAATHLNGPGCERADAAVHSLAARLRADGQATRAFATAPARHLVETEAQCLGDTAPAPGAD
ncbi:hypothetical protein ACIQ9P_03610 [Kitasatospora sp. NPDC094019]|uniref:hypothetical protein n=1 Tax=Kitasatospora sp. NPDC094019 TaxID=3364091 RepID=UPI0038104392